MLMKSLQGIKNRLAVCVVINLQTEQLICCKNTNKNNKSLLTDKMKQLQNEHTPSKDPYDEEPVFFCKRCLSLNIRQLLTVANMDYCEDCGATDIESTSIEEWEKLYKERYGVKFLNIEETRY